MATEGAPSGPTVTALQALRPAPRIVVLGAPMVRDDVVTAVALGVEGYVSEDDGADQLVEALNAVRRSERYLSPTPSRLLERRPGPTQSDAGATTAELTAREREVLELIVQGKTERQIAQQLDRSPKTVHAHRTRIMKKLDAHNAISLFLAARRLGLIE